MNDTGLFLNYILSSLMKKIIVPTGFHAQVKEVKLMLENDVTGLIDVLTDFAVQSASVHYGIETNSDGLNGILKKWLAKINIEYLGKIMPGIDEVSEEYYKERWKASSFPVLKLGNWQRIGGRTGLRLPTRLFLLDGGSIYAKDKDDKNTQLSLLSYDYYLTNNTIAKNKLAKDVIFTNPYGRVHDKYPKPYLIKRGTFFNYKVIESLKKRQNEILEQIIPYMFLVKKGSEALAINKIKTYGQEELKQVLGQFQTLIDDLKTAKAGDKTTKSTMRVTNFDEELKHLIPDLTTIFKRELFSTAEKSVLSSLGFIDIAEAISDSRKESILSPKVFIEEVKKGVKDFKKILNVLMLMVWEENKSNVKYKNVDYRIVSSPITGFMTSEFKQELRLLWKHGKLSDQTYCELVGEMDYAIEVKRREKEAKDGIEITMYPHITENTEKDVTFEEETRQEKFQEKKTEDKNGKPIPEDKLDENESKDKYTFGGKEEDLVTAPYKTVKDLDPDIRKVLAPDLRKTFINTWNNSYDNYKSESRAFRMAWGLIKKLARKNKKGIWTRKKTRVNGKLEPIKLTSAMLEAVIEKEDRLEKQEINAALELKKLELIEAQTKLANKLLKGKESK